MQDVIKALKSLPVRSFDAADYNLPTTELVQQQLRHDSLALLPLKKVQGIVSALRASHLRREGLCSSIEIGNRENEYEGKKIPNLALLREVETRWSSTFLLIDRVLEMYPVRTAF